MKLLVIVVLLIVVGAAGYWLYQSNSQKASNVTLPGGGQSAVSQQSATPKPEIVTEKGNFSQKGNVSIQEDGSLWLVWDEPGKLALNVKLKFNDQSICYLGGVKKDCGLLVKSQENYYVSVEGNKAGDEVIVTKLEELQLLQ